VAASRSTRCSVSSSLDSSRKARVAQERLCELVFRPVAHVVVAAFGLCIAVGHPLAFAWLALAEIAFVGALALRRELLIRTVPNLEEEAL
jgi:hypothetical protein